MVPAEAVRTGSQLEGKRSDDNDHHGTRQPGGDGMNARRPRTRYERARARIRRQLRADLSRGPVHPEDSALVKALSEGTKGPGKAGPLRDRLEGEPGADCQARAGIRADGLPAEHPESMVLELSPADEVGLAALSNDLWPHDEYQQIVAEDYGQRWDGAS
jgi:hypothetical protein